MGNKNIEIYLGPKARMYGDDTSESIRDIINECDCGHFHLVRGDLYSNYDYALYNIPEINAHCISSEILKYNGLAVKVTDRNNE